MDAKLKEAKEKLGFKHRLKEKQVETLKALYDGNDCISVLPTGYGKSIIYQLLPWFLRATVGIVLVVAPLTSIIMDQVSSLVSKGVKAAYLGFRFLDLKENQDDSLQVLTQDYMYEQIEKGDINILFSHPEALFTKKVGKLLRSDVYQEKVCCITIDEAHMIQEWGEDFRPHFRRLGELTCVFPKAGHLSLTATATDKTIRKIINYLQYEDPVVIKENPDRTNIFIEKIVRPPNIKKIIKYDSIIEPLCQQLKEKKQAFPVTIVYVENLESLGYFYQYLAYNLKDEQYIGENIPENRMFAQYHKDYTSAMKEHIISELKRENPKLRLILATVALGMGIDAHCVSRIVHCRPPTTLENFFQEIGRAGRSGNKCQATLHFNNSDIAHNRKGLSDAMVNFCKNNHSCLRLQLLQHFGFNETMYKGPPEDCCSNCKGTNLELLNI